MTTRTRAGAMAAAAIVAGVIGAGAQSVVPSANEGERVFWDQGCYGCHTVGKTGTPIGPDLSGAGLKFSREALRRWLADPQEQRPAAHMPKLELTPEQVENLAMFLAAQRRS